MDSLTQIVLGAAVGEAVLGRKAGNKAMLWGGIAGTLPDLDILANLWYPDDLHEIVLHRGYSHSLFVHILISFPLAWLCWKLYRRKYEKKDWYLLWVLGLTTHALLDACTTYGTRLFLPFSHYPVGFNNISVIDPSYTLPFMFLLLFCLFFKRDDPRRRKWLLRAFIVSSSYMLLTFVVKGAIHVRFSSELKKAGIRYNELKTSPTFFNNALWAGIAISDSVIWMGEYSLLQKEKHIRFIPYQRGRELEKKYAGEALSTLIWFSQGAYLMREKDSSTLEFFVVKWGRSDYSETDPLKTFVFYYQISKKGSQTTMKAIRPSLRGKEVGKAFSKLWRRIFSAAD